LSGELYYRSRAAVGGSAGSSELSGCQRVSCQLVDGSCGASGANLRGNRQVADRAAPTGNAGVPISRTWFVVRGEPGSSAIPLRHGEVVLRAGTHGGGVSGPTHDGLLGARALQER